MPAAEPLLAVRGVHKRFGGVRALRGVDLETRAGEVMAHLYAVRDAPTLDAARAAADR